MATAMAGVVLVAGAMAAFASPAEAAPSCAEGPQTVGDTIFGTPCADTIRAPRSITTVYGEGGDDVLYGQRGNDFLYGGEGNDRLYGGIGDDQLRGGPGADRLSGGFGADSALDGEAGDDFVRGDATIDNIQNTGGGTDTLSYATGVTPGFFDRPNPPYSFPDFSAYEDFPQSTQGRGAYINLETGRGDNGRAPDGGGFDEAVAGAEFEVVVGTPFADYIVGTPAAQTIYGGGGADVILGKGGGDQVYGGTEGDYCEAAGATRFECEFSGGEEKVEPRNPSTVSAGNMAPQAGEPAALFLTGSSSAETLVASYSDPPGPSVQVLLAADGIPIESFTLDEPPDSVVVAGMGGDDTISASDFPATTSVVLLGGDGEDRLTGGETEDALVDGPGNDSADAGAGDDAVPNNEGTDDLHAGTGDDLFISNAVCEGDVLDGGDGNDNANWANFDFAVSLDLDKGLAGLVGANGQPECPSGAPSSLHALEDIEGSNHDDTLIGNAGSNQLLGRLGADSYFAEGGDDSILANSGDSDTVIDCGEGFDTAQIDIPTSTYADPAPVGCEAIHERAPNSFRPPDTPPAPETPATEAPPPAPSLTLAPPQGGKPARRDTMPPSTTLLRRPPRVVFAMGPRRQVSFAFAASEAGSTFRCKLDGGPFKPCRSPRRYRLAPGRHAFRVYAIDPAGNRDRSPVVVRVRVRRG